MRTSPRRIAADLLVGAACFAAGKTWDLRPILAQGGGGEGSRREAARQALAEALARPGRELPHARVVRALSEAARDGPARPAGELTLTVPRGVARERSELVVWIERPRAAGLLDAARVEVPAP